MLLKGFIELKINYGIQKTKQNKNYLKTHIMSARITEITCSLERFDFKWVPTLEKFQFQTSKGMNGKTRIPGEKVH